MTRRRGRPARRSSTRSEPDEHNEATTATNAASRLIAITPNVFYPLSVVPKR